MKHSLLRRRSRRRFTFLEVTIVTALTFVFMGFFSEVLVGGAGQLATAHATTKSTVDAERPLALIRSELRNAGTSSASGLELTRSGLQPGNPVDTITYSTLADPDPSDPFTVQWGPARVIRFEASPGEDLTTPEDDDGDFRVNEGRVVLYNDPPSEKNLIAVLVDNVSRFELAYSPGSSQGLPTLALEIETNTPLRAAVTTAADVQQLKAGAGPRRLYVARRVVTFQN